MNISIVDDFKRSIVVTKDHQIIHKCECATIDRDEPSFLGSRFDTNSSAIVTHNVKALLIHMSCKLTSRLSRAIELPETPNEVSRFSRLAAKLFNLEDKNLHVFFVKAIQLLPAEWER